MKKLCLLLPAVLLLACLCPSLPMIKITPTADEPVVSEPLYVGNTTVTRLYPRDGDLRALLQAEAPRASALGQHMFVEFDASW